MDRIKRPLIVQNDKTLLLEVYNPMFEECRDQIHLFSELEKSPEFLHTYRISPLSIWNAASLKLTAEKIINVLDKYSKYPIPKNIVLMIQEQSERYGKVKLVKEADGTLIIQSDEEKLIQDISVHKRIIKYIEKVEDDKIYIELKHRGQIKQALLRIGYPVQDLAGYDQGAEFQFNFRKTTMKNKNFEIRDYQKKSIETFHKKGSIEGGSGVIVLPCGAGKTMVGIGVMQITGVQTLILVTNTLSIRQWKSEILDKTSIKPEEIGEYSGERKEIKPITIVTYNIITHKKVKGGDFSHFDLFSANNWGLVIYDEVHLLPAPVFRMTAALQAKRRLGLTATLVREDGCEDDVFSLIGPKKYDVPWKELEKKTWIAEAQCYEIRIDMPEELKVHYNVVGDREKYRLASENPNKLEVIDYITRQHADKNILIIGHYIQQLDMVAAHFNFPLITGQTPIPRREELYQDFRDLKISCLIVSRVANFSIDLPDAAVAIQISGAFGSRQEETQRLGRIIRAKSGSNKAYFYSVISQNTSEEGFSKNRQLFLTEQGYEYHVYTFDKLKANFEASLSPQKNTREMKKDNQKPLAAPVKVSIVQ